MCNKIGLIIFTLAFGVCFPESSQATSSTFGFWSESPSLSSIRRPFFKFYKVIDGDVVPLFAVIRSPLMSRRSGSHCGGSVSIYIKPGQLDFHNDVMPGLLIEHVSGDAPEHINYFLNEIVTLHDNQIRIPINLCRELSSSFDILIRLSAVDREGRFSKPSKPFRLYRDSTEGKTIIRYQPVENQKALLDKFLIAAENIEEKILSSRVDLGITLELVDGKALVDNVDIDNLKEIAHEVSNLLNSYDMSLKAFLGLTDLDLPPSSISPAAQNNYLLITEYMMLIMFLQLAIEADDSTLSKNVIEGIVRPSNPLNPLADAYPDKLTSARQALKYEFSD